MAATPPTLSATDAAALLGVSRPTLYAYVSRGLVASSPGPGPSRARRYPRADLEAFLRRRERSRDRLLAAHDSLHHGLPVLDSALTLIEDGRCFYRGEDVVELSRSASFECVAGLLWSGGPAVIGGRNEPNVEKVGERASCRSLAQTTHFEEFGSARRSCRKQMEQRRTHFESVSTIRSVPRRQKGVNSAMHLVNFEHRRHETHLV